MKTKISFLGLIASVIVLLSSFISGADDEKFTIDTKRSSIQWVGKKVIGEHNGVIKLSSGEMVLNNNILKSGSFVADMKSMSCSDLEGESNKKIIDHLKSEDFFSVSKYPTSKFQMVKVKVVGINRVEISGNLTIKGITQPISFTADTQKQGNEVTATANKIKVDRTKYDIKYGSKNFFSSIGDKAIDDDFELTVNLVATK